jgi:YD repeat-containing protein
MKPPPASSRLLVSLKMDDIMTFKLIAIAVSLLLLSSQAFAQNNTEYQYDSLGRLVRVKNSGGPTDGVQSDYQYDSAGNRTNVTVSGTGNNSGSSNGGATISTGQFIIVPLNGFTIIKIN